jgi:hypothetical protein
MSSLRIERVRKSVRVGSDLVSRILGTIQRARGATLPRSAILPLVGLWLSCPTAVESPDKAHEMNRLEAQTLNQ